MRCLIALVAVYILTASIGTSDPTPVTSFCDLAKDFPAYRNRLVTVRGVYYYGLRQECPQKCAERLWPSFLNLKGGETVDWNALREIEQKVEADAKATGKRFEIWVTVKGRLETNAKQGPCDKPKWNSPGYGHLNIFPAQIVVDDISEIEVKTNPNSRYDYANMYHGPM